MAWPGLGGPSPDKEQQEAAAAGQREAGVLVPDPAGSLVYCPSSGGWIWPGTFSNIGNIIIHQVAEKTWSSP